MLCREMKSCRRTGYEIDDKGIWSFKASTKYEVLSEARLTGFESCAEFPAPGDSWPGVPRCRLNAVTLEETERITSGSYRWRYEATVNYTSRPFDFSDNNSKNEATTDPINWRPVWSGWTAEPFQVSLTKDLDNKPFLNPAGDRFSDGLTLTVFGASVVVTRNYTAFSGSYALSLIGKCNADSFSGAAKGQLLLAEIQPTEKDNGEMVYYEVAVTIKYNPLGWDKIDKLNIGSHVKDSEGKKVLPTDANGNVSTEPVLIALDGTQLPDTATPDDATYTTFRVCDYINFRSLGLI